MIAPLFFMLVGFALQQPSTELDIVMKRATAYVAKYESDLGNLVGTENYLQNWRLGSSSRPAVRRTSADLLIIQVGKEWAALRKVNRIDGVNTKKKEDGFGQAFTASPDDNKKRLIELKIESAQYNLGDIVREINSPTFALKVLREAEVERFSFERTGTEKIGGISTWVVRFTERGLRTLVRGDHGELLHSTGTFWIEPATGRILKSEFLIENTYATLPVKARTVVTYAKGKTVDMLVPSQMVEHYSTPRSTIDCLADYSNFRRFEVNVKFDFGTGKPN